MRLLSDRLSTPLKRGGSKVFLWNSAALLGLCLALLGTANPAHAQQIAANDLSRMSIEDLTSLQITSVSKREESLSDAAAAVFVITKDNILRSGATSVPEALRLAPNLQVARLDANNYAIAARGFNHNSGTSNKLLVLMDGRTVYSPLFSGTFWDSQSAMVEDLDRIEVISGAGGTLWGSNAVNGVINIVSQSARDTQGLLLRGRAGTFDSGITARYGGMLGENTAFRVYARMFERGPTETITGADTKDSWQNILTGFRTDWSEGADSVTVQGDYYSGTGIGTPSAVRGEGSISGANILANWTRDFADESQFKAKIYFDNARRVVTSGIIANVDTYDFDTQYAFAIGEAHAFLIGGGYRLLQDRLQPGPGTVFLSPADKNTHLGNIFAQDAITLSDTLKATIGIKLEHNSYTGWEYMPSGKLAWKVAPDTLLWASISRSVRTPSRFDTDLVNTGILIGGPSFDSEYLLAYETGYRGRLADNLSLSVSLFYNDYEDLRTIERVGAFVVPLEIKNNMYGYTYGLEAWADYSPLDGWRLSAGLSTLYKDLALKPGNRDVGGIAFAGNDPNYQLQLRSSFDITEDLMLDLWLRNVDGLKSPRVSAYVEMDARLSYSITPEVEVAVVGQNLFHDRHIEFINPSVAAREIPRSFYIQLRSEL